MLANEQNLIVPIACIPKVNAVFLVFLNVSPNAVFLFYRHFNDLNYSGVKLHKNVSVNSYHHNFSIKILTRKSYLMPFRVCNPTRNAVFFPIGNPEFHQKIQFVQSQFHNFNYSGAFSHLLILWFKE